MTDAIVSAVAGRLISLLEEQARYHIDLVRGAEKEVLKLANELEMVRNVLDDAENQQFREKNVKNCCINLNMIPEGMHKLQHLHNAGTRKLKQLPQLNGLHTFDQLRAGGNGFSKLGILKDSNLLSGTLYLIIMLSDDYVEDAVNDATEAELRKKMHLHEISIRFYDESKNEKVSPVQWLGIIEALEPHPNLKCLSIKWYGGTELPSWIAAPPYIYHLRRITIKSCNYISSLPPLGKLVFLEEIMIFSLDALQVIGREFLGITTNGEEDAVSPPFVAFPKLKKLSFGVCRNWKEWEDITAEEEESADLVFMPCLTHLSLISCPKLTELPRRLLGKMSLLEVLLHR